MGGGGQQESHFGVTHIRDRKSKGSPKGHCATVPIHAMVGTWGARGGDMDMGGHPMQPWGPQMGELGGGFSMQP